ncbi:MAG: sensor histidine kinase [Synechococcaceae bacterium WB9_2_112]|nr:sensor histidine kinase [Synechococcaceae bacterium WB9_2_112]
MAAWAAGLLIGLATGLLLAQLVHWRDGRTALRGLSLRRLLGWIDSSPSGWLILDRADRVVHLNQRAQRLLQVDNGRLWHGIALAQLCRDQALLEAVHLARRQDRSQRLAWASPEGELELLVMPADGGWLALLLTSRRSLEAQLAQQERWVSDVAHELKTPLTALLLVGESLAARVTPATGVLVERLQRELLRLQQLVGDLLELSRLENSLPDPQASRHWFEAPALVEQVWQGLRPLADARGVQLALQEAPATARIQGDSARVHRALLNLLDNALRYSPEGGTITVQITLRGRWCVLAVLDQGPGFSPEDLDHLFERFYRGDPSRERGVRTGSGLGLAIVQQIVASQGGRVVASNHGHAGGGAVVELILPASPPLPRVPPVPLDLTR